MLQYQKSISTRGVMKLKEESHKSTMGVNLRLMAEDKETQNVCFRQSHSFLAIFQLCTSPNSNAYYKYCGLLD